MDRVQRPKADCHSPAFPGGNRPFSTVAALFHGPRKSSRGATISLIPFCLILLFGVPARAQSETDDKLVPQDTVKVSVSGWDALRGGVTEGAELNGAFTIDTAGKLDLPAIGQLPAAGLRESELAKLITDRLQARSGFDVRPVTTVQRKQSAASSGRAKVEEHPLAALPDVNGSRTSREELDTMRRVTADAGVRARAVVDATALQGRALEEQKQRAELLARDLAMAQREVESLQAKAVLAVREKAAALGAHQAAEASLSGARRALDEERQKVERFERDLAAAQQSLDALEVSGKLAAAAQFDSIQRRQVAEAAAKRAGEALVLERRRADALAIDLDAANQDRDAAKQEVARLSAALEQQRETAIGLARDLTAARNEIDILKARDAPRAQAIEPAPNARASDRTTVALARKQARSTHEPEGREIRKVAVRKSAPPVRLTTITLPAALLPTRAPLRAAPGVW